MKLRHFRAPTMHEALAQVKRQVGPDAVIVRTRTYKTGGILGLGRRHVVEITARQADVGGGTGGGGLRRQVGGRRVRCAYGLEAPPAVGAAPFAPVPAPDAVGGRPAVDVLANDQIKSQIGDLRDLVENLVREQRQLHAPQMPEKLFDLYLDLLQREVAEEIARELVQDAQRQVSQDQLSNINMIRQKLVGVLDKMISAAGPIAHNLDGSARVVAFIGPTGVGKTTTIAKLAANFKLRQNKKVGFITIDTYRIGAVDQLRMYADILGVPLKVVVTPTELAEAVGSMQEMDYVLIDTAGRSQNDQIKLRELQAFLASAKPHEVHLVLSGTSHHSHILNAADCFGRLGVDRVIFTKLDEAVSFGVIFSVVRRLQASLSYVTTGQDVPDDIEVGSGRRLARLLLGLDSVGAAPAAPLSGQTAGSF